MEKYKLFNHHVQQQLTFLYVYLLPTLPIAFYYNFKRRNDPPYFFQTKHAFVSKTFAKNYLNTYALSLLL